MSKWTTEKLPGYRSMTIKHGSCTLIIHRPDLTDKERERREALLQSNLSNAMKSYIRRKEGVAV